MNKILMIHSGGTLGMINCLKGYKTQKGNLKKLLLSNPNIASEALSPKETNCKSFGSHGSFATPILQNGKVTVVDLYEFEEILDSSSASPKEWCTIAALMNIVYDKYDAFVIIHGTDTLSYAASCLCFLVEGLTVPVVFTGSVLPMVVPGSDAERNIIGAIKSCLLVDRPSVYLFFNGWLHHGARTTKISSDAFDCFYSTNPLRIEDLEKKFSSTQTFSEKRRKHARPLFHSEMSHEVGILKIHPAMHPSHFRATLDAYKAVILETYGCGTFPANRTDLVDMMKFYIGRGGVIVSVSQCADGNISEMYESNSVLSQVGVISAKNMTTEAAFAKLSFLLANRKDEIKESFKVSFCGEIKEWARDTRNYSFNNYTRAFLL